MAACERERSLMFQISVLAVASSRRACFVRVRSRRQPLLLRRRRG